MICGEVKAGLFVGTFVILVTNVSMIRRLEAWQSRDVCVGTNSRRFPKLAPTPGKSPPENLPNRHPENRIVYSSYR